MLVLLTLLQQPEKIHPNSSAFTCTFANRRSGLCSHTPTKFSPQRDTHACDVLWATGQDLMVCQWKVLQESSTGNERNKGEGEPGRLVTAVYCFSHLQEWDCKGEVASPSWKDPLKASRCPFGRPPCPPKCTLAWESETQAVFGQNLSGLLFAAFQPGEFLKYLLQWVYFISKYKPFQLCKDGCLRKMLVFHHLLVPAFCKSF